MQDIDDIPNDQYDQALMVLARTGTLNRIFSFLIRHMQAPKAEQGSVFAHTVMVLAFLLATNQIQIKKRL